MVVWLIKVSPNIHSKTFPDVIPIFPNFFLLMLRFFITIQYQKILQENPANYENKAKNKGHVYRPLESLYHTVT